MVKSMLIQVNAFAKPFKNGLSAKKWILLTHTDYNTRNHLVTIEHSHPLLFLTDLLVEDFLAEVEEEERSLSSSSASSSPNNPEEVDDGFLVTEGVFLLFTLSVTAPNTDTPPTGF